MSKFIFITGGVASSLGKGIAAASLGSLLQSRGYSVKLRKIDPYLNVDPGTMNPYQHGEVFITNDGAESDLDLGHYERFTGINAERSDSVSMGSIYEKLLMKERRGDYLSKTIQVIPHVTDLLKEFITNKSEECEFMICEIGGTVGDIEALPCFEAIRQMRNENKKDVIYIHLTLVPYIKASAELKTKPTQHSVKELSSLGIQPDILLCRAEREMAKAEIHKIASFCNLSTERVIQALDQDNIYKVPLAYSRQGLDLEVLKAFNLDINENNSAKSSFWESLEKTLNEERPKVNIAIVGKYTGLQDAYKSLNEAFEHAGFELKVKPQITWIDAETLDEENIEDVMSSCSGVMVPGGFGQRGIAGKLLAIKYAREKDIPFFGICLGMQLAVIEFMRNVVGVKDAGSTELSEDCAPVIDIMRSWVDDEGVEHLRDKDVNLGGSMRMGAYKCYLEKGSRARGIYKDLDENGEIIERHRHRYEVNFKYVDAFTSKGLKVAGWYKKNNLPEIVELQDKKWFMAVQFHPEFISKPSRPHPLFVSFLQACKGQS